MFSFKSRKIIAFFTTLFVFVAMYFFTLKISPDILKIVGVPLILAIMANAITFIGGIVFEKWTKSKYFVDNKKD